MWLARPPGALTFQPLRTACTGRATCPPATGAEAACHRYNQNTLFTGTANSKAVQVKYANGSTRWFMAFNGMIHVDPDKTDPPGNAAADIWRVLWATSNDGKSWTVDPQILFRDTSEGDTVAPCHGEGLLVTSMTVDSGYFYLTLNRLQNHKVLLLRSAIDTNTTSLTGYTGGWQVATGPDTSGNWTWQNVTLGAQTNFASLGADAMPLPGGSWYKIRQAAITRVFKSSSPYSGDRYVGLAAATSGGADVIHLYTTTSMDKRFTYQSTVDTSQLDVGSFGLEFGFTQYPDNTPSAPKMIDDQLDFWMVSDFTDPTKPWDHTRGLTATRYTAVIHGIP